MIKHMIFKLTENSIKYIHKEQNNKSHISFTS